jgi:hypothetical protein
MASASWRKRASLWRSASSARRRSLISVMTAISPWTSPEASVSGT